MPGGSGQPRLGEVPGFGFSLQALTCHRAVCPAVTYPPDAPGQKPRRSGKKGGLVGSEVFVKCVA